MRFRDTRPEPDDGSRDERTAAQIMAAAFAGGGAVRLSRGFGRMRLGVPMSDRYQACLRIALNDARRLRRQKAGRWVWPEREGAES